MIDANASNIPGEPSQQLPKASNLSLSPFAINALIGQGLIQRQNKAAGN